MRRTGAPFHLQARKQEGLRFQGLISNRFLGEWTYLLGLAVVGWVGVPGHGGEVERVKLGVELGTHLWVRRTLRCVIREVRLTGVGSRLGHVARC